MDEMVREIFINDEREQENFNFYLKKGLEESKIWMGNSTFSSMNDIENIPRYKILDALVLSDLYEKFYGRIQGINYALIESLKMISQGERFGTNIISEWLHVSSKGYLSPEKQEDLKDLCKMDLELKRNQLSSGQITYKQFQEIVKEVGEKCSELRFRLMVILKTNGSIRGDFKNFMEFAERISKPLGEYMFDYFKFYISIKDSEFSTELIRNYK